MITIKVEPWQVVKAVYDMSVPVGLGFLHYVNGDISEETAKMVTEGAKYGVPGAQSYHLDYVAGRQCKFGFKHTEEGCTFDDEAWYDHTKYQLEDLIAKLKALEV